MKKILFVCSANKDRSKTAEDYFSEKYPELDIASAGTNKKICHQLGTQHLTSELMERADQVIVMEEKHRKYIKKSFHSVDFRSIKVLEVPDRFDYYQKELIDTLRLKVEPILDRL